MTADRYTKAVLTVIVLCLLYLCLGRPGIAPVVSAQSGYNRVVLYGWVDDQGHEWQLPLPVGWKNNGAPLPAR